MGLRPCDTPENCPNGDFLSSIGVDPLSDGVEGYSCDDINNALVFIAQCVPMFTTEEDEVSYLLEGNTPSVEILPLEVAEKVGYSTKLFPNPFSDHLSISLQSPQNQNLHLSLYDLLGRVHHTQQQEVQAGNNRFQLQLPAHLPDGVLFLAIKDQQGNVESHKVIHQGVESRRDDD